MSMIGPPDAWIDAFAEAGVAHNDLLNRSESWANYLKAYLDSMSSTVTTPNFSVSWPEISAAVPLTWGTAYSAPTLPSVPEVTGMSPENMHAFAFTDAAFTPDCKADTAETIAGVLNGAPLMGQTAWDDLYTDAADDITVAFVAATLQAGNIAGMLGELPGESLVLLAERAASDQRKALSKARLTLATEQAKAWREDATKMVEAGAAHDQLYGTIHNQEKVRGIQIQQAMSESSAKIYTASWQSVAITYAARLAGAQAAAVPAQVHIDSEKTRASVDNQILQLAVENAKLNQGKGIADANLHMEQLKYIDALNIDLIKTVATLTAHTMGSYLSAGSINYGATASTAYNNGNSYTMSKDEN